MTDPRITDEMVEALLVSDHDEFRLSTGELARKRIAAVLPLIERDVIERLAGEAGENPWPSPANAMQRRTGELHVAWEQGAAAGVAAERARWKRAISPIEVMCDEEERPDLALIAVGSTLAALLTKGGSDAE
jgi:hypothetical protein